MRDQDTIHLPRGGRQGRRMRFILAATPRFTLEALPRSDLLRNCTRRRPVFLSAQSFRPAIEQELGEAEVEHDEGAENVQICVGEPQYGA